MTLRDDDDDVSWDRVPTRTVQGPTVHQSASAQTVLVGPADSSDDSNNDAAAPAADGDSPIPAKWKELKKTPLDVFAAFVLIAILLIVGMKSWDAEQEHASWRQLEEQRWSQLSYGLSKVEAETTRLSQVLSKGEATSRKLANKAMEMEVAHDQFRIYSESNWHSILQEQRKEIALLQRQIDGTQFQNGVIVVNDKADFEKFKIGEGFREYSGRVRFPKKFKVLPHVTVALKGFDGSLDQKNWMTVRVKVDAVHREYFTFKVATWSDSQLYTDIAWTAITIGNQSDPNPETD